ncbi:hypothetical protein HDU67_003240, partial [Dinochytrium kinnereticum]
MLEVSGAVAAEAVGRLQISPAAALDAIHDPARPSLMQVFMIHLELSSLKGTAVRLGGNGEPAPEISSSLTAQTGNGAGQQGRHGEISLRVKFRSCEVVARNVKSLEDLGPCEFLVNFHSHKFDSLKIDVFMKATLKSKHIGRVRIPLSAMENWHSGSYISTHPIYPSENPEISPQSETDSVGFVKLRLSFRPVFLPFEKDLPHPIDPSPSESVQRAEGNLDERPPRKILSGRARSLISPITPSPDQAEARENPLNVGYREEPATSPIRGAFMDFETMKKISYSIDRDFTAKGATHPHRSTLPEQTTHPTSPETLTSPTRVSISTTDQASRTSSTFDSERRQVDKYTATWKRKRTLTRGPLSNGIKAAEVIVMPRVGAPGNRRRFTVGRSMSFSEEGGGIGRRRTQQVAFRRKGTGKGEAEKIRPLKWTPRWPKRLPKRSAATSRDSTNGETSGKGKDQEIVIEDIEDGEINNGKVNRKERWLHRSTTSSLSKKRDTTILRWSGFRRKDRRPTSRTPSTTSIPIPESRRGSLSTGSGSAHLSPQDKEEHLIPSQDTHTTSAGVLIEMASTTDIEDNDSSSSSSDSANRGRGEEDGPVVPRLDDGKRRFGLLSPNARATLNEIEMLTHAVLKNGWKVSKGMTVKAMRLIYRWENTRELPRSERFVKDRRVMELALRFNDHCMCTYGALLMQISGYGSFKDHFRPGRKGAADHLGLRCDDILCWSFGKKELYRPRFYICNDTSQRAIVIAIQGTMHLHQVATDLQAEYFPLKNGSVHLGMLRNAQWIINHHLTDIIKWARDLDVDRIVCTGHSLGSGVATILTFLIMDLMEEIRRESGKPGLGLHMYGLGTPPVVSGELAEEFGEYFDNFIFEADFVPRLSYGTILDF